MKHADLASVRWYAVSLAAKDMPGTSEMLSDMATEIEAWRELGAALIAGAQGAHDGDRDASRAAARSMIDRMRALLPAKETPTDG